MRRIGVLVVAVLCTVVSVGSAGEPVAPAPAPAKAAPAKAAPAKAPAKSAAKHHAHVALVSGHNAAAATLRTEPLTRPSGDVWLKAENLGEEVKLNIYKADGSFDEDSLAKLDDMFRCVRTGEVRAVRRELYEQLSRIYDHFEGKEIDLVSGFRFAERNSSRHYHASAMDIHIPGVSINALYTFAETLDPGGMGIGLYPTSQFIHVDFRAPGEPSYRWTDYSGHGGGGKKAKKPTGHTQPARKPTS